MNPNRQSNQGTKALSPPECPRFLYSCLSFPGPQPSSAPSPGTPTRSRGYGLAIHLDTLFGAPEPVLYAIRTTSSTLDIGQTPKRLAGHYRPTRLEARGTPMEAGQDRPCRVPVSMKSSWRNVCVLALGWKGVSFFGSYVEGIAAQSWRRPHRLRCGPAGPLGASWIHRTAPGGFIPGRARGPAPSLGTSKAEPRSETDREFPSDSQSLRRRIGPPDKGPYPDGPRRTPQELQRSGGATSSACRLCP